MAQLSHSYMTTGKTTPLTMQTFVGKWCLCFLICCLVCQSCSSSRSHVWMWELGHKEGWVLKNGCLWTVVLEKALESPLDCKEIQPVHPKGDQSWIFIGRTDTEAPILWPPDGKSWLVRRTLMLGKIEGRGRRGRQGMRWLEGIVHSMDMS